MTQNNMILNHLENIGGITDAKAWELYGVNRLSARIKDLRGRGHDIETVQRTGKNRYGKAVRFAEYRMRKEP